MKTKLVLLTAAIAMSHTGLALAQSSSTISAPAAASAAPAATTANTSTATSAAPSAVRPGIKYFGQLLGPGLKFEGAQQSTGYGDNDVMMIDNRPKFFARIGDNMDAGVETRFFTNFSGEGWNVTNGSSRLFVNFKNVVKNDIVAVSLMPRIMLPTSNTSHNTQMTYSPELVANVDISPKDSRFTINTGIQVIKHLYSADPVAAKDFGPARSITFDPWLEVDYQLNPTVQLTASYWPDWATARGDASLANKFQELDVGAYVEVAKGWQIMPYVGTNFNGFDSSDALKSMQLNVALSGTIL
jgi:hypothetical protein